MTSKQKIAELETKLRRYTLFKTRYDGLYKQAVGILGSFVNYFWKNATPEPTDGSKETGHVSQPGA